MAQLAQVAPAAETTAPSFGIRELASMAGVSVRALRNYDRLGLLTPARAGGGAEMYSESDLHTLAQIVALKSLGVPLKRIGALRKNGSPDALLRTLGTQRRALEQKQPLVDRVLFAVRNVEDALGRGERPDPAVIRPLAEALRRPAAIAPRPASPVVERAELRARWANLLNETQAAGAIDPASATARALATKWARLMELTTGGAGYRRELRPHAATLDVPSRRAVASGRAFDVIGPALARWAQE